MSQFQIFTVNTKISETETRLGKLKGAVQKIKENMSQVEVLSVERVNKVALFSVKMSHTSEYTIKMGGQYYAKVKASNAIQVLSKRIQHFAEQLGKWEQTKKKLMDRQGEQTRSMREGLGQPKSSMEPIGVNQQGQQIFNIVQYSEGDNQISPLVEQKGKVVEQKDKKEEELKVMRCGEQSWKQREGEIKESVEVKEQIKQKEQKPKKMSKFKAQRLNMKDK